MRHLSVSELHQLLECDFDTGRIYWKPRPAELFTNKYNRNISGVVANWNRCHAGKEAFVNINSQGYKHTTILGHALKAHRVIWAMKHGVWPKELDHIDGNPLNNNLSNLREVSHAVNGRNTRLPSHNTSGVIGVYWNRRCRKWVAQIKVNQKVTSLGLFPNKDDAIRARANAAEKNEFHPNHGRKFGGQK